MGSNSFGKLFTITTWGESHGKAIGVVIDGCPAGVAISEEEINQALAKRAPGGSVYTSPRKEKDAVQILSGVFEGMTTGTPISLMIANMDAYSRAYADIKTLYRPGHANFTYLQKYGLFDWRGGGRASARETASRVAAGAVAKKILQSMGVGVLAYLTQVGPLKVSVEDQAVEQSALFCPDKQMEQEIMQLIEQAKSEGDSVGGVVRFVATGVPAGLGDPVYEKLEAKLAHAMMSLPASKGFEIGSGYQSVLMRGSEHNDLFENVEAAISTKTNFAGGVLGGISTGMPLVGSVAFKPTSSIKKPLETVTTAGEKALFELPEGSRHDPCVAIRAVPVVEAMLALVLVDAMLMQRSAKL